jgi:hypothetical protein
MNYPLVIAWGLLFLAASFLVTHSTARIALVVLSCVTFLIAVILTFVGTAGMPGGRVGTVALRRRASSPCLKVGTEALRHLGEP